MESYTHDKSIILFDGICNLCHFLVMFIIKRDPKENIMFASLQSEIGKKLLKEQGFSAETNDSIVLIEDGQAYVKSTAALRLARKLNGLWPVLYPFIIIPVPIRDFMYGFIASNRYNWFGVRDQCMMPTPSLRKRFLE